MAKLSKASAAVKPEAAVDPVSAGETAAPVAATPAPVVTMPFQAEDPNAVTKARAVKGENLFAKRKEQVEKVKTEGSPFTYDAEATAKRQKEQFTCICNSKGTNAHVIKDKNGNTLLVGTNCLKTLGVAAPAKERKSRSVAPGVNKTLKLQEFLKQYQAPFLFVREQQGTFVCACGGHGTNQVLVKDANGIEFAVGKTCATQIPGVELPKTERAKKITGVAGLKGSGTTETPAFSEVG